MQVYPPIPSNFQNLGQLKPWPTSICLLLISPQFYEEGLLSAYDRIHGHLEYAILLYVHTLDIFKVMFNLYIHRNITVIILIIM